jgi:5-methylcytosine-specific restriction endonuclease McrA
MKEYNRRRRLDPEIKKRSIIQHKKWMEDHPRYHTQWHARHKVARNAQCRKWRKENSEYDRERHKRYRLKYPERVKSQPAQSRERQNLFRRRYLQRHPEMIVKRNGERRTRLLSAKSIPFKSVELEKRLSIGLGKCWLCGAKATQVDHVKPIAKGGAHMLCNLRSICARCNGRKRDLWPLSIVFKTLGIKTA